MNSTTLQPQLQLPYRRESWNVLLLQILPGRAEVFQQPVQSPLTSENQRAISTDLRQIGRFVIPDAQAGEKILAVFEVDVAPKVDLLRNRVALRQLVARCIDEVSAHGVLAFFVQPGRQHYRLTYATRESALNPETLAVETRETATRRFTYILGPGETRRTAALRLAGLATKRDHATLKEVTDAFSVELLNKEFFDTYKAHYLKFCSHLLAGDAPSRVFGLNLKSLDEKARDQALKPVRDFVKKMMGRLVFLHFLQKKGWLGCPAATTTWKDGDPEFLSHLFHDSPAREQERFHSRRLVPLFFETLNCQRKGDLFSITNSRVPYLNGGLFERDFDRVEQIDFPADLFRDLLGFFAQYNFTIDENDPDDHEIGIDPEMLGHIFENLLEDNKDKGAFYTPKAIVQYMCRQSLIHALVAHFPNDPVARVEVEKLIRTKEPIDAREDSWLAQHATQLTRILDDLRICDPAIGSGAFPIGLLQEIYWTKLALNPSLDRAKAKRDIIQKSIYGVDLDAGAVEIARLRFWLALIVEEDAPRPLPNLDYKIMQGDSLLESFEGIDLSNLTGKKRQTVHLLGTAQTELGLKTVSTELTVEFAEGKQAEITKLISGYFDQPDPDKKQRLHRQIDALVLGHIEFNLDLHEERMQAVLDNARKELKRKQAAVRGYQPTKKEAGRIAELEAELAEVDRKRAALAELQEKPERPFFLWHLFFQDVFAHGGFDIVIGNPPYGADIPAANVAILRAQYETLANSLDSFIVFMEQAGRLLHAGGTLSFIIPCGWVSTPSCSKLRSLFAKSFKPHAFASLPYDVFGEAYVDTMIVVATRLPTQESWETIADRSVDLAVFPVRYKVTELADFDRFHKTTDFGLWGDPGEDGFLVTSGLAEAQLVAKLRKMPKQFNNFGEVMRGIETYNPKSVPPREHSRRALVGDIHRYEINHTGEGFIKYPPAIESSKPWRFFSGPRILLRQLLSRKFRLQAAYAEDHFLTNQSVQCLLARDEMRVPIKVLLAVLNSKLISWYFCQINMVARRDDFPKTIIKVTRELPLPDLGQPKFAYEHDALNTLVNRIIAAKQLADAMTVEQLETQIDALVFRIYGLSPEEVELVQATSLEPIPADVKSALFSGVLPALKTASPYFTIAAIAQRVQELGLDIKPGTLSVYLTEATAAGLIHDAGRGWYSALVQELKLDTKPVAPLVRLLEKKFPLLDFHCWATAQINPYMHHLLGKSVAFVNTDSDAMEAVADFLRSTGYDAHLNPRGDAAGKFTLRAKTVVVRKRVLTAPVDGHFARMETLLVDLLLESQRLRLMDAGEFRDMARAVASAGRLAVSSLVAYAADRKQTIAAVFGDGWVK